RPGLHRLDRHVGVAVGAHHDDGGVVALGAQGGEQVEAAHFRHPDVGQDEVGAEGIDERQRLLAAFGGLDLVTMAPQQRAQHDPQVLLVVHDQNASHSANISTKFLPYMQPIHTLGGTFWRARPGLSGSGWFSHPRGFGRDSGEMLSGLDQLSSGHAGNLRRRLRNARVGLLTHAAAIDRRGRHGLDVFEELGVGPALLFAAEHGLDALAQAEEAVPGRGKDGITVISVYGDSRESLTPTADQLAQIDLLVIDLVDIGSRYYTYVWTALLALRAAAAAGVHVVILDRPNPISGDPGKLEGVPQAEGYLSFVGLEPLPIRHSMTIAELLLHFCERDGLALG